MDSAIAIIIILTPFIFYSYMLFPEVKVFETRFFVYSSNYYGNVSTFLWVFLQKFIFLYLMIIWYFTSTHWWNKSLLVPIGMLLYQTINLLNVELKFKDEALDGIIMIPLVIGVCVILGVIRNKMFVKVYALDLKDMVDEEIKKIEKEIENDKKNRD